LSERRYYSHSCIRLEKPIEPTIFLEREKPDSSFLLSCLKDQKPVHLPLKSQAPVLMDYMPADADDSGRISYSSDLYGLYTGPSLTDINRCYESGHCPGTPSSLLLLKWIMQAFQERFLVLGKAFVTGYQV